MMKRTTWIGLIAAVLAWPSFAQVNMEALQGEGPAQPPKLPYREIDPIGEPRIPTENKAVLYFHSAECPFCRALEHDLHEWAATLPPSVTFLPIPLAVEDTIGLARAFYVGKLCSTAEQFHDYSEGLYSVVQDQQVGHHDLTAFQTLASQSGIDPQCIAANWNDERVANAVIDAHAMLQRYQVDRVPTLVIFSRYAVSPDSTGGDLDLMLRLTNGLISRHLGPGGEVAP